MGKMQWDRELAMNIPEEVYCRVCEKASFFFGHDVSMSKAQGVLMTFPQSIWCLGAVRKPTSPRFHQCWHGGEVLFFFQTRFVQRHHSVFRFGLIWPENRMFSQYFPITFKYSSSAQLKQSSTFSFVSCSSPVACCAVSVNGILYKYIWKKGFAAAKI